MCLGAAGVVALLGRTGLWGGGGQLSAGPPCVTLVLLSQKGVFQLSNEDYFRPLDGVPCSLATPSPTWYTSAKPRKWAEPGDSRAPGTCGVKGVFLCY